MTVDPSAFGPRFTKPPLTRPAYVYGGPGVAQTGVARDGLGALGASPDDPSQPTPAPAPTFPWGATAIGFLTMALGGALTGYLATGGRGWKGPMTGALTHLTIFSIGTALAGRNALSTGAMLGFAGAGVAAGAGAGYLFWRTRRAGHSQRPSYTLRGGEED